MLFNQPETHFNLNDPLRCSIHFTRFLTLTCLCIQSSNSPVKAVLCFLPSPPFSENMQWHSILCISLLCSHHGKCFATDCKRRANQLICGDPWGFWTIIVRPLHQGYSEWDMVWALWSTVRIIWSTCKWTISMTTPTRWTRRHINLLKEMQIARKRNFCNPSVTRGDSWSLPLAAWKQLWRQSGRRGRFTVKH